MSTTFRPERAGEAIRTTVARALTTEVQDPRLRGVTITAVDVTHDLQFARIYYTVLGDDDARRDAERGFESAQPFLRGKIGQEVPLRSVPEIGFYYDQSIDNAQRIEDILSSLPELKKDGDLET
jgi:ribosome-binding factor A